MDHKQKSKCPKCKNDIILNSVTVCNDCHFVQCLYCTSQAKDEHGFHCPECCKTFCKEPYVFRFELIREERCVNCSVPYLCGPIEQERNAKGYDVVLPRHVYLKENANNCAQCNVELKEHEVVYPKEAENVGWTKFCSERCMYKCEGFTEGWRALLQQQKLATEKAEDLLRLIPSKRRL